MNKLRSRRKKEFKKVVLGVLVFSEKPDVYLLLCKRMAAADQSTLSEVSLHLRRLLFGHCCSRHG